jgi:hypothetical protein
MKNLHHFASSTMSPTMPFRKTGNTCDAAPYPRRMLTSKLEVDKDGESGRGE